MKPCQKTHNHFTKTLWKWPIHLTDERQHPIVKIKPLNRFYSVQLLWCCVITLEILQSFPVYFPCLVSVPVQGYVTGNQQHIRHAKENVIDGDILQKPKRECETTSKSVAQLLPNLNLDVTKLICKTQIYPSPMVIALFLLAMLQLFAFQNVIESFCRINNSKVSFE